MPTRTPTAAKTNVAKTPVIADSAAKQAIDLPHGMQVAGAWAWRILAIAGVIALLIFLIIQLRLIVIPLLVATLLAALLVPFSEWLQRHRWPKWLAVALSEIGLIAIVAGLVVLVVTQVVAGFPALQVQALERFDEVKAWLLSSPLHLTDGQITDYFNQAIVAIQNDSQFYIAGALSFGSSFGHFLAGVLLTLFSTLFILIDGRGIFNWLVRLFPRKSRAAVHGAGEAGWITLTNFAKVQIFVAAVDATGIGLGAFFLGLPLVIPIAVAVFLGSFIPVVGAVLTGVIAVFVALVFNGPVAALIMLAVVLFVQQLEGHVLQPLIVGSVVKVHPLAVVLAVAAGGFLGGIPGALFAVPVIAVLNVVVSYIAEGEWRTNPHPQLKDVLTNV
jgi:putative heme transporter